jgi:hypothetical protein
MKSHYPNMAIPLKKHPEWPEVVAAILTLILMVTCLIGFLAVCQ